MSFEIYVQVFADEKSSGIPLKEVYQSFGEYILTSSPTLWRLKYNSENSCDIYVHGDRSEKSRIEGFTVYRPCSDKRLWNSLFEIMGLGHVALYFSGSRALLRTEASVRYLPTEMLNALGGYRVIESTDEILNELSIA